MTVFDEGDTLSVILDAQARVAGVGPPAYFLPALDTSNVGCGGDLDTFPFAMGTDFPLGMGI